MENRKWKGHEGTVISEVKRSFESFAMSELLLELVLWSEAEKEMPEHSKMNNVVEEASIWDYGFLIPYDFGIDIFNFTFLATEISRFTFNTACNLVDASDGCIIFITGGTPRQDVFFASPVLAASFVHTEVVCNALDGLPQCNAGGFTVLPIWWADLGGLQTFGPASPGQA
jgi:hypothetical protein